MDDLEKQALRDLLWYISDLALSRKTGSIKALALDVAGPPRSNRQAGDGPHAKVFLREILKDSRARRFPSA